MTLVELLVVMVIMLILATIVVAFAPGFQDAQKVARGADQLQGWLLTARQWAKKDRIPTGIRFYVTTDTTTSRSVVTDLQYIQQPPTFIVPSIIGSSPLTYRRITTEPTNPLQVKLELAPPGAILAGSGGIANVGDFTGGFGVGSDSTTWPVQVNDSLILHGLVHQVVAISSNLTPPTEGNVLTLSSTVSPALTDVGGNSIFTSDYYFIRAPRALTGESTLKLPGEVVIDVSLSQNISTTTFDVLFSPSGELLAPSTSNKVILWVRDITRPLPPGNIEQDTLIVVDSRTGLIGAQPVNPDSTNYYAYTKDGRSSGL